MIGVEKKQIGKAKIGLVVSAVLTITLAISIALVYTNLQIQISALETDNTSLHSQINTLQIEKSSLEGEVSDLEANRSMLESQANALQIQVSSLTSDKNSLQNEVDSLTTENEDLQAQYDSYLIGYQRLRDTINHRWGLQDLENFITPRDSTVDTLVLNITGGWSNPDDWDEYWYDLQAMYNWVVNNIEYSYDGLYPNLPYDPTGSVDYWAEMWQFPNETLDLGWGDCEDIAILLCSMIRCYNNMELWTECISIANSFGHVAVQCPIEGDKVVIFDPAGLYYSCDSWGNIIFIDISTEIDNWLNYWKPEIGNDVYVDLVFSDYIHKTFVSTDDYTAWMYSR